MPSTLGRRAGLLAAWGVFALFAFWGTAAVPFHPDESTFLYMSRDFELLFLEGRPAAVSWQAEGQPALVSRYRLLDAPLGRYLAGFARALAGEPPLAQDWDWSATWEANASAGALPGARALTAARLPATLLLTLSVLLVYAIGWRLGGPAAALTAALLYGLSGLSLLHGRRAMSEAALLFFSLLAIWLLMRPRPNPLLGGLALAAAMAAKLTALFILPVAVIALLLPAAESASELFAWRPALRRLALFGAAWLVSLWLLHPSLWTAPLAGLDAMLMARRQFFAEQAAFLQAAAPYARLTEPGLRALTMLAHVYFAPLAYADVGNYAAATAAAEQRYQAAWLTQGWHASSLSANFLSGGLLLWLTLLGLIESGRRLRFSRRQPGTPAEPAASLETRAGLLLAVWTLATVAGLLSIVVPAQRYYLPLVPMACLWSALGLTMLARPLRLAFRRPRPTPLAAHD